MTALLIRGGKSPLTVLSPEQHLATTRVASYAANSGNILFTSAVHRAVSIPGVEAVTDGHRFDWQDVPDSVAGKMNERFDRYVLPLADAFRPGFAKNLKRLTHFIERLDMPVTVVGVGATLPLGESVDSIDPEHAEIISRFTRAVLDRSATIGVRGRTTADLLAHLGFGKDSVRVIGCPSMFRNGPLPSPTRRTAELTTDSRIALHATPGVPHVRDFVDSVTTRYPQSRLIAQLTPTLELLIWGDEPQPTGDDTPRLTRHHCLYRQDRIRFFVDAPPWIDYLRTFDFTIGTRIHGSIAALCAGTPAMLLAHDTRTAELAEYHGIPYRQFTDYDPAGGLGGLYDSIDTSGFAERQQYTFQRYQEFLVENDLPTIFTTDRPNEEADSALRTLPFPGPVHGLMAPGALGREQIVARLSWLRQGFDGDRAHPAYAFHPPIRTRNSRFDTDQHAAEIAKLKRALSTAEAALKSQKSQLASHSEEIGSLQDGLDTQAEQLSAHAKKLSEQAKKLNEQAKELRKQSRSLHDLAPGAIERRLKSALKRTDAVLKPMVHAFRRQDGKSRG